MPEDTSFTKRQLLHHQKMELFWEKKKKKREMEKNKYIISSVNKTRDKVEASEKSIKEEKSSPT